MHCKYYSVVSVSVLVAIAAVGCHYSFSSSRFDYKGVKSEKNVSGKVDSDTNSIVIENQSGNILVKEGEIGWEWYGACWATDESDSLGFLDELDIEVVTNGDEQTWTVKMPEQSNKLRGVKSNLTLSVPQSVSVRIANKHGDVEINGIQGSVNVENRHGGVKAVKVPKIQVTNAHGDVETESTDVTNITNKHGATDVKNASQLTVHSKHGKVKVESVATIDIQIEHGSFSGTGITDSCKINSEHASIELTMGNDQFSSISVDGEHSPITIKIPSTCKPNLQTKLEHGKLKSSFQDDNQSEQSIKVNSEHGNVSIQKKK